MNLQNLIEEQKKEAREGFEKDLTDLKSTGDAVVDRALLLTLIDQITTTAITKGYELALDILDAQIVKKYGDVDGIRDLIAHLKETK